MKAGRAISSDRSWLPESMSIVGARACDREFAGEKVRLPAGVVGSICGCARDRAIAAAARAEDRHRTANESGVRYRGGSGVDPGARSVDQLAGAQREGARFAFGARSSCECKRGSKKARGNKWTTGVARIGQSAFPNRARDCARRLCGPASAWELAQVRREPSKACSSDLIWFPGIVDRLAIRPAVKSCSALGLVVEEVSR